MWLLWEKKTITDCLWSSVSNNRQYIYNVLPYNTPLGYVSGVSAKLKCSSWDVVKGYEMIRDVKQVIEETCKNEQEFDLIYNKASDLGVLVS